MTSMLKEKLADIPDMYSGVRPNQSGSVTFAVCLRRA